MSNPIHQKIAHIFSKTVNVKKTGFNAHFGYKYVKEEDLVEMIRPLFAEQGLHLSVHVTEVKEFQNNCIAARLVINVFDSDGNAWNAETWGMGQDKGDKGLYKAITGGFKYWLYKSFMIPTGDDPEVEAKTPDLPAAKPSAPKKEETAVIGKKAEDPLQEVLESEAKTEEGVAIVGVKSTTAKDGTVWYEITDNKAVKRLTKNKAIGEKALTLNNTGTLVTFKDHLTAKGNAMIDEMKELF